MSEKPDLKRCPRCGVQYDTKYVDTIPSQVVSIAGRVTYLRDKALERDDHDETQSIDEWIINDTSLQCMLLTLRESLNDWAKQFEEWRQYDAEPTQENHPGPVREADADDASDDVQGE